MAEAMLIKVKKRWPTAQPLEFYPAFNGGITAEKIAESDFKMSAKDYQTTTARLMGAHQFTSSPDKPSVSASTQNNRIFSGNDELPVINESQTPTEESSKPLYKTPTLKPPGQK
jgi:hypothetical protein